MRNREAPAKWVVQVVTVEVKNVEFPIAGLPQDPFQQQEVVNDGILT
jgi:hypothetical protein